MASLLEQIDFFAAVLWHKPMTEGEMRKCEAFHNYSVDTVLMMLERRDMIFYKNHVIHVKKSAAKKLGDHVQVHIEENCRKCKGSGIKGGLSIIGQANWPCEKCVGSGKVTIRE